ncbi:MAG: hypothetical protein RLZZ563_2106 [Pseudomonadota bacterium]
MDILTRQRSLMALNGALAGLALWLLQDILARGVLTDRMALFLTTLVGAFFAAALGMAGPLSIRRAALGAAPVALMVAGLLTLASLRYDRVEQFLYEPLPVLAAFALGFLPLPFWIAASGRGWRHYPTLFTEIWTMVVRTVSGWIFTGLVWGMIWLSDALLGIVGLDLIDWILGYGAMPWLITGATFGLALAVVTENADVLSPYLILRLLRLLTLPVLAVMVLFVVALPVQGMSGLLGGISAALTLLAMCAAAVTLVSTAVDQSDAEVSGSLILTRSAQALALILPLPAGLAGWAIWLRVVQYGWTPDRLFAALLALVALGYGVVYAVAVLRGAAWRGHVRQGNIAMALVVMALSALWLTPALNAERIATNSQLARYTDGRTPEGQLDLYAMDRWGKAGAAALADLRALAATPGHEALQARLADFDAGIVATTDPMLAEDTTDLLAELNAVMPLQPAGATATRDMLLAAIPADELRMWIAACQTPMPGNSRPGCVFVVADLWPREPGEEAVALLRDPSGYLRYEGLGMIAGEVHRRSVLPLAGMLPDLTEGEALIATLQDAPPAVSPAPLNQMGVAGGLVLIP